MLVSLNFVFFQIEIFTIICRLWALFNSNISIFANSIFKHWELQINSPIKLKVFYCMLCLIWFCEFVLFYPFGSILSFFRLFVRSFSVWLCVRVDKKNAFATHSIILLNNFQGNFQVNIQTVFAVRSMHKSRRL